MGPDPEKLQNSSFEQHPSEYIINQIDDDIEMDVDEENDGYVRLNLDNANEYIPANDDDETSDDEESGDEQENEDMQQQQEIVEVAPNVPEIVTASSELIASVWNQNFPTNSSNIELTTEKSQEITQIMSKINLPNAPNWLNELNSENVLDRIRRRTETTDKK